MNFSPFHKFGGCNQLESVIRTSKDAGTITDELFARHELYHWSLIHKLRSARYHVETLASYLESQDTSKTPLEDIAYRVNFHFDGFLHVVGSATDIFAREILTYFGETLPPKVYFHTAHSTLSQSRPTDPILPLIAVPSWRAEFADYRNTATHESLIGLGFTIQVEVRGGSASKRLVFPIPDDPRADPRTFKRKRDIVEYCAKTFKRVLTQFNQVYRHIAARADARGGLPL